MHKTYGHQLITLGKELSKREVALFGRFLEILFPKEQFMEQTPPKE